MSLLQVRYNLSIIPKQALLNFCDLVSPVLRIYCDRPGKPMIFACTHETRLCARFVLATLPSDAYAVSASQRSQPVQRHAIFSKTPVQVRRVALNPATQRYAAQSVVSIFHALAR